MEDFYICHENLGISNYYENALFGIIDGHGGYECGEFIKRNLASIVKKRLEKINLE